MVSFGIPANGRKPIAGDDRVREKRLQWLRHTVEPDGWRLVRYLGHGGVHSAVVEVESGSDRLKKTLAKALQKRR